MFNMNFKWICATKKKLKYSGTCLSSSCPANISTHGIVLTGGTYIIGILLKNANHIEIVNPFAGIWIAFKDGKKTKYFCRN